MKFKVVFSILSLFLSGSTYVAAQVTPFCISDYGDPGLFDQATNRYYIQSILDLPTESSYPLNQNIRSWAKDFFNTKTGYNLGQEPTVYDHNNQYNRIEFFYQHNFTNKIAPENEMMGLSTNLVYKNKNYVTYKAEFGSNGSQNKPIYETELATFLRKDGSKLTINDIFNCDEQKIKEIMFKVLPDYYPCDLSSAKDIKILSAGVNRYTIDVVGTIYKNNAIVFSLPIEDVNEYLTPLAHSLNNNITISRDEKIKSYMGAKSSNLEAMFLHLMRNNSVTIGRYHNDCLNKDFSIQLDAKYDFEFSDDDNNAGFNAFGFNSSGSNSLGEDHVIREKYTSRNPRKRLYLEVPSDDDTKEVFLEFSKSRAESFINELKGQLERYNKWVKDMESQKFAKYQLKKQGGEECCVFYFRPKANNVSYGYVDDRDYEYYYTYNKGIGKTALYIKSVYKKGTQIDRRRFRMSSDIKSSSTAFEMIDPFNGYTLLFIDPNKEIPQLCKALEDAIKQMK